ncbi:MAG: TraB/GumN family protein, partial [Bacteroidota bacterium]
MFSTFSRIAGLGLLAICLCILSSLSAQNNPNHQLLWEISGNGLGTPSYLFGTMHVRDKEAFGFPDSVLAKLYQVDAFAMEVHPDSATKILLESYLDERRESPMLKEVLSEEEFTELNQRFQQETGISLEGISTDRLFQVEQMLGEVPPEEGDAPTFVDAYLYKLARGWGKGIMGLEDPRDQIALLSHTSVEDVKRLLESEIQIKQSKNYRQQLLDVYQNGELGSIENMIDDWRTQDSTYYAMMLTNRNIVMANSMEEIMQKQSLFAAVGTAHLPGDDGVIMLLRQKGYTLKPVSATYTGLKEYYESLPLQELAWYQHQDQESGFAIDFPTQPISISPKSVPIKMYMTPDLTEGTVYMAAGFAYPGIDPEDSVRREELYQSMAENMINNSSLGGLLEVEESQNIIHQGVEGRELKIGSESWRAPAMRLRIFIKEGALYIAMAVKQNKDVELESDQRFLESLRFTERIAPSWQAIVDSLAAFKVEMPGTAVFQEQSTETEDQNIRMRLYQSSSTDDGSNYGSFSYFYPIDTYFPDDTAAINMSLDAIAARFPTMEVVKDTLYWEDGFAYGMQTFRLPEQGFTIDLQVILHTNRQYLNMAVYYPDRAGDAPKKFFDSFEVLPYRESRWKSYTADDSSFSVAFPEGTVKPSSEDITIESFDSYYLYNTEWKRSSNYSLLD